MYVPSGAAHRKPYVAQFDEHQIALMRAAREKEVKMFSILKEIGVYLVYLLLVTVLVYDNVDLNAFPTNDHIRNTFVYKKFDKVSHAVVCANGSCFAHANIFRSPFLRSCSWMRAQLRTTVLHKIQTSELVTCFRIT